MKGDLNDYISYRISRAYETLDDAKLLLESKRFNSCVNRLYYACFYAANALLLTKEIAAKTHSGVRTAFFKEYIATGLLPIGLGKLYAELFDWRSEGDYADFVEFEEQILKERMVKARDFIDRIRSLIYG